MSSEVRAASKGKNSRSPAMRDSVYEVESSWLWSSSVQYRRTLIYIGTHDLSIVRILGFWGCPGFWGHHSSLWEHFPRSWYSQKSKNYTKIARNHKIDRNMYNVHFINQASIYTSEHAHKGWYVVLEGQGILKMQKFVRLIDRLYIKIDRFFISIIICLHSHQAAME